jgi:hypothetical protein
VPYTPWDEDRLARVQRLDAFRADRDRIAAFFRDHVDATGDEIQQLVAIGVHLTPMRRVGRHERRADREPVDTNGTSGSGLDDL